MISSFLHRSVVRIGLVLALGGLLSACDVPLPESKLPTVDFSSLMPYELNVGQLEIASTYRAPGRAPNIDQDMNPTPEADLKRWAQQRLQPMGTSGSLRFTVVDAAVTETPLKTEDGLGAMFKKQAIARYDVNFRVSMQIFDEAGKLAGEASANAKRFQTVLEGMTVYEREKVRATLVKAAMEDINTQMDKQIRSNLRKWLMR